MLQCNALQFEAARPRESCWTSVGRRIMRNNKNLTISQPYRAHGAPTHQIQIVNAIARFAEKLLRFNCAQFVHRLPSWIWPKVIFTIPRLSQIHNAPRARYQTLTQSDTSVADLLVIQTDFYQGLQGLGKGFLYLFSLEC